MVSENVTNAKRPLGVTIIAILSIFGVLDVISVLFTNTTSIGGYIISGIPGITMDLILIIANLSIAYGFLKGIKWSWWLGLALFVFSIIASLINLVSENRLVKTAISISSTNSIYASNPGLLSAVSGVEYVILIGGLILEIIYIVYLTRPHVKMWFGF